MAFMPDVASFACITRVKASHETDVSLVHDCPPHLRLLTPLRPTPGLSARGTKGKGSPEGVDLPSRLPINAVPEV